MKRTSMLLTLTLIAAACSPGVDGEPAGDPASSASHDGRADGGFACDDAGLAMGADASLEAEAEGDGGVEVESDAELAVTPGPKRVFVTSREFYPELPSYGGDDSGSVAADVICQNTADGAGLGGRWRAWVSVHELDAFDRIQGTGPFLRLDGVVLFPDHESLRGAPLEPIDVTEHGESLDCARGTMSVWTGTSTGGRWSIYDCVGWTSRDGDFDGMEGDACDREGWTESWGLAGCYIDSRLYCFEQ